jgi:hypothetical protein
MMIIRLVFIALGCFCSMGAEFKTRNVVLIVSDGLRWEEVFNGSERTLMTKENGVKNTNALEREFWRDSPEARREALMPFFWNHIAKHGQLLGNQAKGSVVTVSNGKNFSYPGYNEMICGIADARIDSNDKKPNPNTNVFEWLNGKEGLRGKVSVLGTWNVFPYIFNIERSGLLLWPSWEKTFERWTVEAPKLINDLVRDSAPIFEEVILDAPLFHLAVEHLRRDKPRLVFVGFGETDEWAHAGRYDLYTHAAHRFDDFVRRLWEVAQSMPEYREKTTFIVTADHGRGSGSEDWKSHSAKIRGSEADWIAVIGPDTPPLGERKEHGPYIEAQIAPTIAALLGEDFCAAFSKSSKPITDLLGKGR